MSDITMLNFNQASGGGIVSDICLPFHSTYVHYKLFSLFLKGIPIIICIISFTILKLFVIICNHIRGTATWLFFDHNNILLKLQTTAFQILMLFFIPIISDIVQLLNCVYIMRGGEKIPVLFGDASHTCLEIWQYIPLLFLIMYVLPFCFALYVGSCFLQKNRYTSFSVMIIFPWSSIYYHFKDKYLNCEMHCDFRKFRRWPARVIPCSYSQ